MLQVAAAKDSTVRESEKTNEEPVIVASQECLLSSTDEENEGLQKFLRDKLDSISGVRLDRIVEVDPTVLLVLLAKNLLERGFFAVDKEMPRSREDHTLRSELKKKWIGSVSKRPLCDVDADVVDGRPPKSVAFQPDDESG